MICSRKNAVLLVHEPSTSRSVASARGGFVFPPPTEDLNRLLRETDNGSGRGTFLEAMMPLNLERIRKLMGDRSQAEVAEAAGMMQPNLSRILAGRFEPRMATLAKLAAVLGCRAKDLIK